MKIDRKDLELELGHNKTASINNAAKYLKGFVTLIKNIRI